MNTRSIQTKSALNVAEELFLIGLNDDQGRVGESTAVPLQFALGGAILTDLFFSGKIRIDDDRRIYLDGQEAPCGDALLDEALELIRAPKPHAKKIHYWMNVIVPGPKKILKRVGDGLVRKGVLAREEKRYLWMLSYDVYPQRDGSAKYWIKQQLRGVVLANQMPDVHAVAVLSLLEAAGLLDLLFTRDEYRSARKRTGRIIEAMELRRAERHALDEVCTAVSALVGSLKS